MRILWLTCSLTIIALLTPLNHRIDVCVIRWALSLVNAMLAHSLYVDVRRFYLGRLNSYHAEKP